MSSARAVWLSWMLMGRTPLRVVARSSEWLPQAMEAQAEAVHVESEVFDLDLVELLKAELARHNRNGPVVCHVCPRGARCSTSPKRPWSITASPA